jgi:menaquinone-dependent protoporphyrinogen IX oxidase
MMFGWHPAAIQFITKHLPSLQRKPTAFFMMAMRLTDIGEKDIEGVPFFTDPGLSRPAPNPDRLSLPERFSTVRNYLRPVLKNSPGFFPVSVGFFGGKLDTRRLNPVQWLFVRLILRIPSEDKRNRQAIRSWTADIHEHLSHG